MEHDEPRISTPEQVLAHGARLSLLFAVLPSLRDVEELPPALAAVRNERLQAARGALCSALCSGIGAEKEKKEEAFGAGSGSGRSEPEGVTRGLPLLGEGGSSELPVVSVSGLEATVSSAGGAHLRQTLDNARRSLDAALRSAAQEDAGEEASGQQAFGSSGPAEDKSLSGSAGGSQPLALSGNWQPAAVHLELTDRPVELMSASQSPPRLGEMGSSRHLDLAATTSHPMVPRISDATLTILTTTTNTTSTSRNACNETLVSAGWTLGDLVPVPYPCTSQGSVDSTKGDVGDAVASGKPGCQQSAVVAGGRPDSRPLDDESRVETRSDLADDAGARRLSPELCADESSEIGGGNRTQEVPGEACKTAEVASGTPAVISSVSSGEVADQLLTVLQQMRQEHLDYDIRSLTERTATASFTQSTSPHASAEADVCAGLSHFQSPAASRNVTRNTSANTLGEGSGAGRASFQADSSSAASSCPQRDSRSADDTQGGSGLPGHAAAVAMNDADTDHLRVGDGGVQGGIAVVESHYSGSNHDASFIDRHAALFNPCTGDSTQLYDHLTSSVGQEAGKDTACAGFSGFHSAASFDGAKRNTSANTLGEGNGSGWASFQADSFSAASSCPQGASRPADNTQGGSDLPGHAVVSAEMEASTTHLSANDCGSQDPVNLGSHSGSDHDANFINRHSTLFNLSTGSTTCLDGLLTSSVGQDSGKDTGCAGFSDFHSDTSFDGAKRTISSNTLGDGKGSGWASFQADSSSAASSCLQGGSRPADNTQGGSGLRGHAMVAVEMDAGTIRLSADDGGSQGSVSDLGSRRTGVVESEHLGSDHDASWIDRPTTLLNPILGNSTCLGGLRTSSVGQEAGNDTAFAGFSGFHPVSASFGGAKRTISSNTLGDGNGSGWASFQADSSSAASSCLQGGSRPADNTQGGSSLPWHAVVSAEIGAGTSHLSAGDGGSQGPVSNLGRRRTSVGESDYSGSNHDASFINSHATLFNLSTGNSTCLDGPLTSSVGQESGKDIACAVFSGFHSAASFYGAKRTTSASTLGKGNGSDWASFQADSSSAASGCPKGCSRPTDNTQGGSGLPGHAVVSAEIGAGTSHLSAGDGGSQGPVSNLGRRRTSVGESDYSGSNHDASFINSHATLFNLSTGNSTCLDSPLTSSVGQEAGKDTECAVFSGFHSAASFDGAKRTISANTLGEGNGSGWASFQADSFSAAIGCPQGGSSPADNTQGGSGLPGHAVVSAEIGAGTNHLSAGDGGSQGPVSNLGRRRTSVGESDYSGSNHDASFINSHATLFNLNTGNSTCLDGPLASSVGQEAGNDTACAVFSGFHSAASFDGAKRTTSANTLGEGNGSGWASFKADSFSAASGCPQGGSSPADNTQGGSCLPGHAVVSAEIGAGTSHLSAGDGGSQGPVSNLGRRRTAVGESDYSGSNHDASFINSHATLFNLSTGNSTCLDGPLTSSVGQEAGKDTECAVFSGFHSAASFNGAKRTTSANTLGEGNGSGWASFPADSFSAASGCPQGGSSPADNTQGGSGLPVHAVVSAEIDAGTDHFSAGDGGSQGPLSGSRRTAVGESNYSGSDHDVSFSDRHTNLFNPSTADSKCFDGLLTSSVWQVAGKEAVFNEAAGCSGLSGSRNPECDGTGEQRTCAGSPGADTRAGRASVSANSSSAARSCPHVGSKLTVNDHGGSGLPGYPVAVAAAEIDADTNRLSAGDGDFRGPLGNSSGRRKGLTGSNCSGDDHAASFADGDSVPLNTSVGDSTCLDGLLTSSVGQTASKGGGSAEAAAWAGFSGFHPLSASGGGATRTTSANTPEAGNGSGWASFQADSSSAASSCNRGSGRPADDAQVGSGLPGPLAAVAVIDAGTHQLSVGDGGVQGLGPVSDPGSRHIAVDGSDHSGSDQGASFINRPATLFNPSTGNSTCSPPPVAGSGPGNEGHSAGNHHRASSPRGFMAEATRWQVASSHLSASDEQPVQAQSTVSYAPTRSMNFVNHEVGQELGPKVSQLQELYVQPPPRSIARLLNRCHLALLQPAWSLRHSEAILQAAEHRQHETQLFELHLAPQLQKTGLELHIQKQPTPQPYLQLRTRPYLQFLPAESMPCSPVGLALRRGLSPSAASPNSGSSPSLSGSPSKTSQTLRSKQWILERLVEAGALRCLGANNSGAVRLDSDGCQKQLFARGTSPQESLGGGSPWVASGVASPVLGGPGGSWLTPLAVHSAPGAAMQGPPSGPGRDGAASSAAEDWNEVSELWSRAASHQNEEFASDEEGEEDLRRRRHLDGWPDAAGSQPEEASSAWQAQAQQLNSTLRPASPKKSDNAGAENKEEKALESAVQAPPEPPGKGVAPPKGKGKGPPDAPPSPPKKGSAPALKGKGKGSPGSDGKGTPRAMRKPEVLPRTPLKKLFWSPINLGENSELTVWERIHQCGAKFDADELEALFGEAGASTARGQEAAQPRQPTALRRRRVLEEKRRRELWFMLALMPDLPQLLKALELIDDSLLEPEKVELLLINLPIPGEAELIRSAEATTPLGEGETWDSPEQFVLGMTSVNQYALRVRVWGFLLSFEALASRLETAERELRVAADHLQTSVRIEKLLGLVLFIGNYLNGGTARGRADGFDLEALPKLGKLRASGQSTLLDFLVSQAEKDTPGLVSEIFAEGAESESVARARRHRVPELQDELKSMITQAESYLQQMSSGTQATEPPLGDALLERKVQVQARLGRLQVTAAAFISWADRYASLCAWFHVNGKQRPTEEFFGFWDNLFSDLKKAWETQRREAVKIKFRSAGRASSPRSQGGGRAVAEEGAAEEEATPRRRAESLPPKPRGTSSAAEDRCGSSPESRVKAPRGGLGCRRSVPSSRPPTPSEGEGEEKRPDASSEGLTELSEPAVALEGAKLGEEIPGP
ncbi:unnamed protein product [Polarella glacialis]|uniref:FH2 domain-containing protein n=1 Tax=Polarella glacialis TaxID=89957 RepID=A0A813FL00_POLGL|nr:unnamed protein product [Polarella glacialis]